MGRSGGAPALPATKIARGIKDKTLHMLRCTKELQKSVALGQTIPSHSALVRINVCCSPQATKSRTSRQ
jgi:hypothetical protein